MASKAVVVLALALLALAATAAARERGSGSSWRAVVRHLDLEEREQIERQQHFAMHQRHKGKHVVNNNGDSENINEDVSRRRDTGQAGWKDRGIFIAVRYTVPPQLKEDFMDRWQQHRDDVFDGKFAPRDFYLRNSVGDNLYFWGYMEWERGQDWFDFVQQDSNQDWLDWLEDHDVYFDFWPLLPLTDQSQERREDREELDAAAYDKKSKKSERGEEPAAHVLITYHVNPSDVDDFISVFNDVAESTWQEEGNQVYALRQVATKNHHFFVYGSWDSMRDYVRHFDSDHVRRLRKFAAERSMIWKLSPLLGVGEGEEEEQFFM